MALLIAAIGVPDSASAGDDATTVANAPAWEWGPSIQVYIPGQQQAYVQPTLTADRGKLHLEGRYNAEALNTASAWLGWNLAFGEEWKVGITPMVGGVFGKVLGVAPGFTFTLGWGPLALWCQGEYVFDLREASQSDVYVWSEFSVTGPEWLRVGLALQRTRVFETSTAFQAGPLAGFFFWKLSTTVYLFAPGQQDQFVVLAAAGTF